MQYVQHMIYEKQFYNIAINVSRPQQNDTILLNILRIVYCPDQQHMYFDGFWKATCQYDSIGLGNVFWDQSQSNALTHIYATRPLIAMNYLRHA